MVNGSKLRSEGEEAIVTMETPRTILVDKRCSSV